MKRRHRASGPSPCGASSWSADVGHRPRRPMSEDIPSTASVLKDQRTRVKKFEDSLNRAIMAQYALMMMSGPTEEDVTQGLMSAVVKAVRRDHN